jgi:hypothetical protein
MRQRFLSFGIGFLILAVVFALAMMGDFSPLIAFVCNDARMFYGLGALLIFGGALFLGARPGSGVWDALLVAAPLVAAVDLFVVLRLLHS